MSPHSVLQLALAQPSHPSQGMAARATPCSSTWQSCLQTELDFQMRTMLAWRRIRRTTASDRWCQRRTDGHLASGFAAQTLISSRLSRWVPMLQLNALDRCDSVYVMPPILGVLLEDAEQHVYVARSLQAGMLFQPRCGCNLRRLKRADHVVQYRSGLSDCGAN